MKSPFAILLAIVVLIGIVIGGAAIFLLGPTDQDDTGSIPIALESELPTPSTRNVPAQPQSDGDAMQSEVVVTVQVSGQGATGGQRGFGAFGGGGPAAGGGNFQAIQEAMENNSEIQELLQKAQSGNMSQEDQARLRELMQEALAEAGIEAPAGGQGGFGAPPTTGTITAIFGATITIEHDDDSGLTTDLDIGENTNITVINELTSANLTEGTNVAGTVRRGEGGRIFIINLTVIPEQQGGFRGLLGGGLPSGNDATNLSNINGTIAEINDQTISVETTQGSLRLTVNEDSKIIATSSGSLSDIAEGMAAIAFGGNQDNTPIQPNSLIVGPESLLQQDNAPSTRGGRRQSR